MYQMLTGVLPYDTPAPADLERLMRGELTTAPRLRNPSIPKRLNDIILKAMAPDVGARYQRASDLLAELLDLAHELRRPPTPARAMPDPARSSGRGAQPDDASSVQSRLKPRETPAPRFCWQCRKPLHARTDRCPFCGEAQ
jgi:serine/threonine protein kinase